MNLQHTPLQNFKQALSDLCPERVEQHPPQLTDQLVINWHITEACNYACKYCYAHWKESGNRRDIIRDEEKTLKLLREVSRFFDPGNNSNPLRKRMRWNSVRLNIAGGEPLFYASRVQQITHQARLLGMSVSLISNGSRLDSALMRSIAPAISLLGLSIDATSSEINNEIGRVERRGRQLSVVELCSVIAEGRKINPDMRVKINTVVNAANHHEDMSRVIQMIQPERWKVLRMLPVLNSDLTVTQKEFDAFVRRHRGLGLNMRVEDNNAMTESYIMIDPVGRFFQNSEYDLQGYRYSPSILESGIDTAFSEMQVSSDKFSARYENNVDGVVL